MNGSNKPNHYLELREMQVGRPKSGKTDDALFSKPKYFHSSESKDKNRGLPVKQNSSSPKPKKFKFQHPKTGKSNDALLSKPKYMHSDSIKDYIKDEKGKRNQSVRNQNQAKIEEKYKRNQSVKNPDVANKN